MGQDGMDGEGFQDRCLKPLGHPSGVLECRRGRPYTIGDVG